MSIHFALVGNQNCGKSTLFNYLTGSNQHVGNFPGVTVQKKEGALLRVPDASVIDLPGIYSLSPYTSEEIVTRDLADARVVRDDNAGELRERGVVAEGRRFENDAVGAGGLGFLNLMRRGEDDRGDVARPQVNAKLVEMRPALVLAVMCSAGDRRNQREALGDPELFNQVVGGRLVSAEHPKTEFLRSLLPCGSLTPGFHGFGGRVEETLDFVHFRGFGDGFLKKERAPVGRKPRTADPADAKEQRGTEGVREEQPERGASRKIGETPNTSEVFRHMTFDGVEPPAHSGKEILGPALPRQNGSEAARFKKAQGRQGHATVADVIGQTTENFGRHTVLRERDEFGSLYRGISVS